MDGFGGWGRCTLLRLMAASITPCYASSTTPLSITHNTSTSSSKQRREPTPFNDVTSPSLPLACETPLPIQPIQPSPISQSLPSSYSSHKYHARHRKLSSVLTARS